MVLLMGTAVIVLGLAVMIAFTAGRTMGHWTQNANWMIHVNGVVVSPYHDSTNGVHSPSASRLLEGRYALKPGQSLAISLPIGDLTVVPGQGRQVSVSVQVSGQSATTDKAQAYLRKTLLMPSTDSQLFALGLGLPGLGGSLSGVHMTVVVPADLDVTLIDHLGTLRVSGVYQTLRVVNNVGNVYVGGTVKGELAVSDNLGNMDIVVTPGSSTRIQDNMGNVDLTIKSRKVNWAVDAKTTLGEIVNDTGWSLVSGKNATGAAVRYLLTIRDNMGNIVLHHRQ